jgi:UDPglucose--hexose-1-phosphate uridylyltransferase
MSQELRWNPLLEEWVAVSGKRKERPWRRGRCPFCPGRPGTEGDWEVLALPNKFPVFSYDAPRARGIRPYLRSRAQGRCEVIVESREHRGDFQDLPLERVSKYVKLLGERSAELGSLPFVRQVVPFKNKGALVGVSMTHPHSQVYATPFVPPRIRKELDSARRYEARHGRNLFEMMLERELNERTRVIYRNEKFVLLVPFFAMWPYEMHVCCSAAVRGLGELDAEGDLMLADAIRIATATYEKCLGSDYAYMMVFHQAPSKEKHPEYRLHVEFYSPQLEHGRTKYAAGIEWGAGTFTYDGVPEDNAAELKRASLKAMKGTEHLGGPSG